MEFLKEYLPILVPIVVIELTLLVIALIHVFRHPHYRFGNRIMWVLIILFFQIIGPITYFILGRSEV